MKNIKKIFKIINFLQLIIAAILTFMMMKAMKLLYIFLKKEGVF